VVLVDDASRLVPLFSLHNLLQLITCTRSRHWLAGRVTTKCCLSPLQEEDVFPLQKEEKEEVASAAGGEIFSCSRRGISTLQEEEKMQFGLSLRPN